MDCQRRTALKNATTKSAAIAFYLKEEYKPAVLFKRELLIGVCFTENKKKESYYAMATVLKKSGVVSFFKPWGLTDSMLRKVKGAG